MQRLAPAAAPPGVVLVCLSTKFGGADVRVLQTARALASHGWRYAVAVIDGSLLAGRLAQEKLAAHPIPLHRGDPRLVWELRRLIYRTRATVLDAHNMQSQYFGALAGLTCRVPVRLATVHSVYRETHPDFPRRQLHEGAIRLMRATGAGFVAVSASVRDDLMRLGVGAGRIVVSRNAIEPLAAPPPAFGIRDEWPQDAFVIAIVGRLEAVKGHAFLFDAMARLAAKGVRRPHLVVVGVGGEEERLRAAVRERGLSERVRFLGFREDVTSVLAGVDMLCIPSLSEGLPYTVLEAARQGVPILSSRVGGIAEVFEDDRTIFFVAPGDSGALAERVAAALRAPGDLRRVGEAAKAEIAERFSVARMIEEVFAAYRGKRR